MQINRKTSLISTALLVSQAVYAGPYVVGSIGAFESDSVCDPVYRSVAGGPDVKRCEKDSTAAAARLGYQWSSGPGFELSYIHTGDTKAHLYDDPLRYITDSTYGVGTYIEQIQRQKNRSMTFAATYSWNLTESFSATAKAGVALSRGKSTVRLVTNGTVPGGEQSDFTVEHTRSRHYIGADLRYQMTANTFASMSLDFFTLGYDKFWPGIQGQNAVVAKARVLSVGIGQKF